MILSERTMQLPRAMVGPLRPCPFCGGTATVEPSPWLAESIRIACGNEECGIQPKTEYLLLRFADELCAAWNARPAEHRGEEAGAMAVYPGRRIA